MKPDERRLLQIFKALPAAQRVGLLDYAEFLQTRAGATGEAELPTEPLAIPRPAEESVVKAIKRLMATYPMLDRNRDVLLNETSALMTQHIMHKRAAVEVIDELEIVFRRHYAALSDNSDNA